MAGEKQTGEFRRVLLPEETGVPSLAAFGYAEGERAPLTVLEHRHRDKVELILCGSGMQAHSISGLPTTVYPGECLFIRPDEPHACLEEQPAKSKVFWIQIDLSAPDGILGVGGEEGKLLRETLCRFSSRRVPVSEGQLHRLGQAFRLFSAGNGIDRLRARAILLTELLELLHAPAIHQALTPDIDRAKQYILLHIKEQLDVDELLLVSGLSMAEFRTKFEAQVGMKPRAFINRIKIEQSKQELQRTDRSDIDIAYLYHFPTVSVYRSQFKKVTGMSVRKYRRSLKKGS